MLTIHPAANPADLALPNDPFPIKGRFVPLYDGSQWSYRIEELPPEQWGQMCFPDGGYAMDAEGTTYLGAYADGVCIGLMVLHQGLFRYLHVEDLSVRAAFRGRGVGRALVNAAKELAAHQRRRGLFLQAQDNNVDACRFYLACGFRIGGLDTEVYSGTSQAGKADVLFYLDI